MYYLVNAVVSVIFLYVTLSAVDYLRNRRKSR